MPWINVVTSSLFRLARIFLPLGLLAFLAVGTPVPQLTSGAEAQGAWNNYQTAQKKKKRKYRARKKRNKKYRSAKKSNSVKKAKPKGPVVINVSLKKQRITVYEGTKAIASSRISSGKAGHRTPKGVFSVLQKRRRHFSNLYRGAAMPNMQRLTWSGIALHAGALPGYPASHGCIRLTHSFSRSLFRMTTLGTRVVVSDSPVSPKDIDHPELFSAFAPEPMARAEIGTASIRYAANETETVTDARMLTEVEETSRRQTYRARRLAEGQRLDSEIREAGYALRTAEIAYRAAKAEAADLEKPIKSVRKGLAKSRKSVKNLEARVKRASRDLAKLERQIERKPKMARYKWVRKKKAKLERSLDGATEKLMRAEERYAELKTDAGPQLAAADAAQDELKAAKASYKSAKAAHKSAKKNVQMFARREKLREKPIAIFISRRNKKIYARQGYQPVIEAPVIFDDPDRKIGTHVYTALGFKANKADLNWSVVSLADGKGKKKVVRQKLKNGKTRKKTVYEPAPMLTPAEALEGITIPDHVREQIADVIKPGSSLVISDRGLGYETGKYTDFIVQTR